MNSIELNNYPELLSTENVSEILHCSASFVRKEILRENIRALKIARTYRIPKSCLIQYLNNAQINIIKE